MTRTAYLEIHEKQYLRLRKNGAEGWCKTGNKSEMFQQVMQIISSHGIKKGARILEMGCGDAELSLKLAENGFQTSGIDISPTAIKWAEEKAGKRGVKGEFLVGNVTNLPYPDSTYDVIIDSLCLHCIIGDDRIKVLSKIHSTMKKDGLFIGFTMCGEPAEDISPNFDFKTRNLIINGIAGRYIGKADDILAELKAARFRIVDFRVNGGTEDNGQEELVYVVSK